MNKEQYIEYPSASSLFDIISKIGQGGFGIVYKARDIKTGNIVALKQINKISKSNEGFPQPAFREILLLRDLKGCSNIIDLKDVVTCDIEKNVFIVYNYSEYDMHNLIYHKFPMSLLQVKSYLKQMIIGIKELHSNGYIHRDIKPSNFLISSENIVTLIDFGLSRKISHGFNKAQSSRYTDSVGTYFYRAPEIILGDSNYSTEIDIWSLGCTLYEMITRENLFSKCNTDADIANQIIQIFGLPNEKELKNLSTLPNKDLFLNCKKRSTLTPDEFFEDKIPEEFKPMKNLLLQMLQIDPKKRITADDALNNVVLSDAVPPENLPPLTLSESLQKGNSKSMTRSSSLQVELKKKQKMELKYEQLRLAKILPLNIV